VTAAAALGGFVDLWVGALTSLGALRAGLKTSPQMWGISPLWAGSQGVRVQGVGDLLPLDPLL